MFELLDLPKRNFLITLSFQPGSQCQNDPGYTDTERHQHRRRYRQPQHRPVVRADRIARKIHKGPNTANRQHPGEERRKQKARRPSPARTHLDKSLLQPQRFALVTKLFPMDGVFLGFLLSCQSFSLFLDRSLNRYTTFAVLKPARTKRDDARRGIDCD